MSIGSTILLYLSDMFLYKTSAKVVDLIETEDKKVAVLLDQTIFYPQGGGQPCDKGLIKSKDGAIFDVTEVWIKDGIVHHVGSFQKGNFQAEMNVQLEINKELRKLHSKNHTAGHLIDFGLNNLGIQLVSGKGYHFPVGPYVEYCGTLEQEEREQLIEPLQETINKIISLNLPVAIKATQKDKNSQPMRSMLIHPYPAIACGGTHVGSTGEIGKIVIRKIKNEKGNLRISYAVV